MTAPARFLEHFERFGGDLAAQLAPVEPGGLQTCSPRAGPDGRWQRLREQLPDVPVDAIQRELFDDRAREQAAAGVFDRNVENFVGMVGVPLGIAGPVQINGAAHKGPVALPLATTEAALVASVNRGCSLINRSGGVAVAIVDEAMYRVPCFGARSLPDVLELARWICAHEDDVRTVVASTSRFGRLKGLKTTIEGLRVHVKLEMWTGDASGQNMVTVAASKVVGWIMQNAPVEITEATLEGGLSGDKKASAAVLASVRGRRVVAHASIKRDLCIKMLRATPEQMVHQRTRSWQGHSAGLGTIGSTFHVANVAAAMYIALGQDPACTVETHAAVSRFEVSKDGDLDVMLTLPAVIVASVGGGVNLPSQRACLKLIGAHGADKAPRVAEAIAAAAVAAEISIAGALVSGEFTNAHATLARGPKGHL